MGRAGRRLRLWMQAAAGRLQAIAALMRLQILGIFDNQPFAFRLNNGWLK